MDLTWHQIGARLVFVGGLIGVWYLLGPVALAGAGLTILLMGFAREIELRGRKRSEPEHWQPDQ